ncbi:hypothetical protein GJ496_001295 [Pomphorhynchus laevis]|nr:hypothetical protein GJ496_001295 [Pomphorhynchus laevis]
MISVEPHFSSGDDISSYELICRRLGCNDPLLACINGRSYDCINLDNLIFLGQHGPIKNQTCSICLPRPVLRLCERSDFPSNINVSSIRSLTEFMIWMQSMYIRSQENIDTSLIGDIFNNSKPTEMLSRMQLAYSHDLYSLNCWNNEVIAAFDNFTGLVEEFRVKRFLDLCDE